MGQFERVNQRVLPITIFPIKPVSDTHTAPCTIDLTTVATMPDKQNSLPVFVSRPLYLVKSFYQTVHRRISSRSATPPPPPDARDENATMRFRRRPVPWKYHTYGTRIVKCIPPLQSCDRFIRAPVARFMRQPDAYYRFVGWEFREW